MMKMTKPTYQNFLDRIKEFNHDLSKIQSDLLDLVKLIKAVETREAIDTVRDQIEGTHYSYNESELKQLIREIKQDTKAIKNDNSIVGDICRKIFTYKDD